MQTASDIGRKLANRYELVEPLGEGSMGIVYGAKDRLLGGVSVAVKFLSHTLLNQKMRERFEREATTCAMLGQRSIHIIRVTDYGVDDRGIPFYVMEHLKGKNLNEMVKTEGGLPIPRFLHLVRQICLGLQCAHKGINLDGVTYPIIHRDIKPSNIFITQDDSLGELVKILDFGIAKTLQEEGDQSRCFMGTLAYASPEQMEGRELDVRSDLYSLGVMMFQMLTGKMPLNAETHTFGSWYKAHTEHTPRSFKAVAPDITIPKTIEALVMDCLAKEPDDRPQNAFEIIEILKPLDERYKRGRDIASDIQKKLEAPKPRFIEPTTPDEICRSQVWPTDKPIADIVFPQIIQTKTESLVTLWIMLPKADIDGLASFIAYNKFMFMPNPHPVLLWLTVLYNPEQGPRWLPSYLDLKKPLGQRIVRVLTEAKHYRLLFFTKEKPHICARVKTLTITEPSTLVRSDLVEEQARHLQKFVELAYTAPTTQPKLSKPYLKAQLNAMKPTIVQKLEAIQ